MHLFTETAQPTPPPGITALSPLSALAHLSPNFDAVVSVVGNSHFHVRIVDLLRRYGAACVAHDARMLGFYRILLGPNRALPVASRELGRPVVDAELVAWLADEGRMEALFLGEIAESASPMIVHSRVTARNVRERHGVVAAYLPFSVYRPWSATDLTPTARTAARARLNLAAGEIAIVTFGAVHATKAPEECIWATEILRGWGVPAVLHFVGSIAGLSDRGATLKSLAEKLGISHHVRFAAGDYVSEQTYRDYLVGSDLAVQLRTYGLGGLSGALLDCAAAGLPTVTNAALAEAVGVPEGYIRSIPDSISPLLVAEGLVGLLEAGTAAIRHEEERAAYSRERSFDHYAQRLLDALGLEVGVAVDRWAA